jgi:hypothetical protein
MADLDQLDRRKHRGPFRFLFMSFSTFMKRYLGLTRSAR